MPDAPPSDAPLSAADRTAILARAAAWGVDVASLRARRAMTPTERLLKNEQALALVEALRAARTDAPDTRPDRRSR